MHVDDPLGFISGLATRQEAEERSNDNLQFAAAADFHEQIASYLDR